MSASQPTSAPVCDTPARVETRRKRVLFVDDEPNFLDGLRRMLRGQREEWNMMFAGSVDEAVAMTREIDFDTIVSDVSMPVKSGLDLLAEMRELEHANTIPIVILTGNAEGDLKRRALDLGATDLLNKPVIQEDLIARVRSVLRLKEFQDQLRNQNAILELKVQERTRDLEQARRDIIWRLAKAGEFRDEETGDHVIRVALCARSLAEAMGMPAQEVHAMFLTAPLHDVGKIGIPDRILLKEGPLTDDERTEMQNHCEIGASILRARPKGIGAFLGISDVDFAEGVEHGGDELRDMAAIIAMSHHEKWDGTGYPNRLTGEDIPLPGLIVAVADVYDALRSKRPYKDSFSVEKTLAIMREGANSHFAPHVFEAFTDIVDEFENVRQRYSE